jgi:hypothetical protein
MSTPVAKSLASFSVANLVAAQAGNTAVANDMMRAAVFNAFKLTYKDGNKNQLIGRAGSLFEQARLYADMGAAKDAGFAKPKVAARLYQAHLSALALFGIPAVDGAPSIGKLADVDAAGIDAAANDAAERYLAQVAAYQADAAAADAAKREARKDAKAKADGAGVGEGTADVPASAVTAETVETVTMDISAMVVSLAEAIQSGMLDDDQIAIVRNALAINAANAALAIAAATAPVAEPA